MDPDEQIRISFPEWDLRQRQGTRGVRMSYDDSCKIPTACVTYIPDSNCVAIHGWNKFYHRADDILHITVFTSILNFQFDTKLNRETTPTSRSTVSAAEENFAAHTIATLKKVSTSSTIRFSSNAVDQRPYTHDQVSEDQRRVSLQYLVRISTATYQDPVNPGDTIHYHSLTLAENVFSISSLSACLATDAVWLFASTLLEWT